MGRPPDATDANFEGGGATRLPAPDISCQVPIPPKPHKANQRKSADLIHQSAHIEVEEKIELPHTGPTQPVWNLIFASKPPAFNFLQGAIFVTEAKRKP